MRLSAHRGAPRVMPAGCAGEDDPVASEPTRLVAERRGAGASRADVSRLLGAYPALRGRSSHFRHKPHHADCGRLPGEVRKLVDSMKFQNFGATCINAVVSWVYCTRVPLCSPTSVEA